MTKELEALHRIANANNHFKYDTLELVEKDFQIVYQGLQRLEAIDQTKPSEALEKLDEIIDYYNEPQYDVCENSFYNEFNEVWKKEINIIKQALLKSQEQEKVLKIIFEKNVNIASLKAYDLEEYNMVYENKLTQEEFDLLKRYFK